VTSNTAQNVTPADALITSTTVSVTYGDSAGGATVNTGSFSVGNITVTNGSTTATVIGVTSVGDTATYTVQSPGADWGSSPQGTYTISVVAGSVTDSNGNGIAASTLSTPLLVDTAVPTATISLASGQANPASTSPILFSVNFSVPVTGFTKHRDHAGRHGRRHARRSGDARYRLQRRGLHRQRRGMANSGTVTAAVNASAHRTRYSATKTPLPLRSAYSSTPPRRLPWPPP